MKLGSIYHIIFLRHGESTGNAEAVLQGQADYPLSETGRKQAATLARRWQSEGVSFDRIIASPLLRARQTAEIVAAALQSPPIDFNPDWVERDYGLLTGLKAEEAYRRYPAPPFMNPYMPFGETGESRWELFLRAGRAVQDLLCYAPGRYLVVAHGAILNMALCTVLGILPQPNQSGARFSFYNTAFARLTYTPGEHTWRLISFNDQGHWKKASEDAALSSPAPQPLAAETGAEPAAPAISPLPAVQLPFTVRQALPQDAAEITRVFLEADELHRQALSQVYRQPEDWPAMRQAYITNLFQEPNNALFVAEQHTAVGDSAISPGPMIGAVYACLREAPLTPVHTPRRFAVVDTLGVLRAYQRQGVGRALMEAVQCWAREKGASEVELTVWEFNASAIAFYENLGYTTANRRMWRKI